MSETLVDQVCGMDTHPGATVAREQRDGNHVLLLPRSLPPRFLSALDRSGH